MFRPPERLDVGAAVPCGGGRALRARGRLVGVSSRGVRPRLRAGLGLLGAHAHPATPNGSEKSRAFRLITTAEAFDERQDGCQIDGL